MSDGKNLEAHVFVCTNRKEIGESCAARGSLELREALKKVCQNESLGWHGRVRINTAGCLGRCKEGIATVIYPQTKWMTGLDSQTGSVQVENELKKILNP
jgi:(2Fe-2S) ferredoxin